MRGSSALISSRVFFIIFQQIIAGRNFPDCSLIFYPSLILYRMRRILSSLMVLAFAFSTTLYGQKTITGTVRNAKGDFIAAANVQVVGTFIGNTTDTLGRYSLDIPEEGKAILVSFIGYEAQRINLGTSDVVDVDLQESIVELNEAVVIGYGTQSRRNLTGSIASVDDRAFKNIPVQSFEQALQGRMAGVMITGASGTLGTQQSVRIRGVGSVTASNQPLYVLDGNIMNNDIGTLILGGGPGSNPLININPNEIASVDVLKDAASSAIYGVRGSNGVVIITTKTGSYNREPVVSLNYSIGFSRPTNPI
jgi:TonB-dependent SusC/RagA subfamily outer membrane receptor